MRILVVLTVLAIFMAAEASRSARNERALRRRGAIEPSDDVYPVMRIVYPGCFLAMAIEGWLGWVVPQTAAVLAGGFLLALSKALKLAVIRSLGDRWSFKVLVLPGEPLVESGPYRWLRHPNYLAVLGELLGSAVLLGAPGSGLLALLGFGDILRRRIRVEEAALAAAQAMEPSPRAARA